MFKYTTTTFDIYFRIELILVIMLPNRRDTQATYRLILKLLYVIYVKKISSVRYKSNIIAFLFKKKAYIKNRLIKTYLMYVYCKK